jgi:hypothetical protein
VDRLCPGEIFNLVTDCTRRDQQVPVFSGKAPTGIIIVNHCIYGPVIAGELYKRGHGVKSWKRRKFQFSGRRIKYFEKNVFKGELGLLD